MAPTTEELRERMKTQPFAPDPLIANSDARIARAAEYAALYLGEIADHLGKIAAQMDAIQPSEAKAANALQLIQQMLPNLFGKR